MTKRIGFAILLLCISVFAFCQKMTVRVTMNDKVASKNNDTIYYSGNRPLTWEDFQGAPSTTSIAGAITSSGFAFTANMNKVDNEVSLNVNVYCFFSKKNSWKKPHIGTAYHLLHEQHHFDITRLSAQKFYQQLATANFTFSNYNQLLTTLFNKAFDDNNVLQQQYDSETRNSINETAQLQWNDKISALLKELY